VPEDPASGVVDERSITFPSDPSTSVFTKTLVDIYIHQNVENGGTISLNGVPSRAEKPT
jgi:hypothetical protein